MAKNVLLSLLIHKLIHSPTHKIIYVYIHIQIVDELYAAAKTKPEWQAAAVKAINGMDLSVFK